MFDDRQINQAAFAYYDRLRRVKCYVEGHYGDEDLSLTKLASIAGLERRYFSTFFHNKTGVRLMDWVTYVRVSEAIALMRTRNHSISRIAFSVGFKDLRTFERAFKRCTDHTPRELKKSLSPS